MSGITRGHSCSLCQRRKVRCDKQKPCANCVKAKVECTVASSQPRGRRRLAKLPEKALIERLKKYEEFMSQHGLNFGSILDGGDEIRSLNYDPSCANTPSSDNTPTQDQKVDNER